MQEKRLDSRERRCLPSPSTKFVPGIHSRWGVPVWGDQSGYQKSLPVSRTLFRALTAGLVRGHLPIFRKQGYCTQTELLHFAHTYQFLDLIEALLSSHSVRLAIWILLAYNSYTLSTRSLSAPTKVASRRSKASSFFQGTEVTDAIRTRIHMSRALYM